MRILIDSQDDPSRHLPILKSQINLTFHITRSHSLVQLQFWQKCSILHSADNSCSFCQRDPTRLLSVLQYC